MSSLKDKPLKKCHTDSRKMIDVIHHELIQDMGEEDKIKYYLDNGLLLNQYYESNENLKTENEDNKKGILNYFNTSLEKEKETGIELTRNKLYNEYNYNVNDVYQYNRYKNHNLSICHKCNVNLKMNMIDGILFCGKCGEYIPVIIESEKGSYNDPPKEINYFAYKRINHFNEWLAQFQAKETTELPESIYQDILKELSKYKELDIKTIEYKQLRDILRKLKYNKFYEHIPHLMNILSGRKPPSLDRKSEEILRSLFKEIQLPFIKHCPPERKNFLSYSYVLHKFCELLEYDHLLVYFPLLKSREKLQQQDIIWAKICEELKWQYIPST